jgi:hypothetical protein
MPQPPIVVRPIIHVPPPTVVVQPQPENPWSTWLIPFVAASAAVIAAIYGVRAFRAIREQIKLQQDEINARATKLTAYLAGITWENTKRAGRRRAVFFLGAHNGGPGVATHIVMHLAAPPEVDVIEPEATALVNISPHLGKEAESVVLSEPTDWSFTKNRSEDGYLWAIISKDDLVLMPSLVYGIGGVTVEVPAGTHKFLYRLMCLENPKLPTEPSVLEITITPEQLQ